MRGALGVALAKARLDPGPAHRVIPHRPRHRRPVPDRLRRSGDVPGRLGWTEPVRCAGRPLWTRPGCGGRLRDGAGAPPNAEPSRIPDVTRLRILFTFSGGTGHLNPLVPIARAAQAAGHVVAVTGQPSMVATIEATGLPAIPTGTGFGDRMARDRAVPLLELCAGWRPHVLVCDETDFGGMVAAERLGLPYATVVVLAAGSLVRPALLAETLDQVRAEHGLPADPQLAMLSRYLVLSPFPPSFRDPAFPLPATAHSIRPQARRRDQAPGWMSRLTGAPVVYFTLGTVFNLESGDLFERVLAGLRTLPVNLVATVGGQRAQPRQDPTSTLNSTSRRRRSCSTAMRL